jgi:predicted ATPase
LNIIKEKRCNIKISISGTQGLGKSTVIKDFLKEWPMYKPADNSYREIAKKNPKVKLNQEGDEETQTIIRDALIDQAQAYTKDENVIFDRCILDNFIYTMWLNAKGKISDLYVEQQLPILKEMLKFYDIIFFIPIVKNYDIPLVPDDQRDIDPIFQTEIDNLFKATMADYWKQGSRTFFPDRDTPAVIEIFGTREERIQMIKLYITKDGTPYGENESMLSTTNEQLKKILI